MLIVAIVVVVGCVVGGAALLAVRRWPDIDPASPAGATHRVGETVHREAATSRFVRDRLDPAATTGLAVSLAATAAVLGGTLLGILAWLIRDDSTVLRLDRSVATWSADHATATSTEVLRMVTRFGGTAVITVLAVAVLLAVVRRGNARTTAGFLTVVVLGQLVIANLVKVLVDRARPEISTLAGFSGPSFPSGHTVAAFACFTAFAMVLGRRSSTRVRALLVGTAIGAAVMVGASRVLLGVHWLTDVLGGAALGAAWFAVCAVAFGGRLLRFGAPVEAGQRAAALSDRRDDAADGPPEHPVRTESRT
jgi:undecaprenyl-diphosphatase